VHLKQLRYNLLGDHISGLLLPGRVQLLLGRVFCCLGQPRPGEKTFFFLFFFFFFKKKKKLVKVGFIPNTVPITTKVEKLSAQTFIRNASLADRFAVLET